MPITTTLLGLLLIILALVAPASAAIVDRIIAQVNNDVVTLSELDQMIKYLQSNPTPGAKVKDTEATRRQMLDILIDRKLAKDEAKRMGITVSDKDLHKAVEDVKNRNQIKDDDTLARQLAKDGMTLDMLRSQLTEQILRDRLIQVAVRRKAQVTDEDIQRFYEEHYRRAEAVSRIKVLEIPFPSGASEAAKEDTRSLAEKIFLDIRGGANFDALATKYQEHGVKFVDPGFVPDRALDPRLATMLGRLRIGEAIPIRGPNGFQILMVADRRGGQARSLEEARTEIKNILMQQSMEQKFSDWMKNVRQKAIIKIFL